MTVRRTRCLIRMESLTQTGSGWIQKVSCCLWKNGGLGLPNVESDLDVVWVPQVYKFLTNKDPKMMMCARRLRDTVAARRAVKDAIKDASFEVILYFLNFHPDEGSIARVTMSGCCSAWCKAASIIWEHCCATWRGMRLTSDYRSETS